MSDHRAPRAIDEQRLDALFSDINRCDRPGAAVGIAMEGEQVYRKGFGVSSLEIPLTLTSSHKMRIASVSKQMTCLAYMLLCEEGKASVDDPVARHLPEVHPATAGVSMRHLMANTSGIRDAYDIFCQFNDSYASEHSPSLMVRSADILRMYSTIDDVNFAEGTSWSYNNGGWLLLSIAIERITQMSLESFLQAKIFKPLGMNDTLLRRMDSDYVSNSATQHAIAPDGRFERRFWGLDNFLGGGAVVSTIDDMLRWLANIHARKVGSPDTWKRMTTPVALKNGTSTNYGFGLSVDSYHGTTIIHHSGNALGGSACALTVPEFDLDVVVLTNRQDLSAVDLAITIVDVLMPRENAHPTVLLHPPAIGCFMSAARDFLIQLVEYNGRQRLVVNGLAFDAISRTDRTLFPVFGLSLPRLQLELVGDERLPSAIHCREFGENFALHRLPPDVGTLPDVPEAQYCCSSIGVRVNVRHSPDGLQLHSSGPFGVVLYRLERLSDLAFLAVAPRRGMIPGGVLCFESNFEEFQYSTFWNRRLRFTRTRGR